MTSNALPEDTHLAYTVTHEAWYARSLPDDRREINIAASAGPGVGVAWDFTVEEVNLGSHGPAIRVKIFDDAFAAFTQIPEFFAALASEGVADLRDVCAVLDGMGAVDETERRGPHGVTRPVATAERIRRAIKDATDSEDATVAVLRTLGMEVDSR